MLFNELEEINERVLKKYETNDTSKIKLKYDRLVSRFTELSNK